MYKLCRTWYQMAKIFHIQTQGQKRAQTEKEHRNFDWTSNANI